MKITIDTKEDSHDELCKVASMLHALIKGRNNSNGARINNNPKNDHNTFIDMFNQPEQEFSLLNSNHAYSGSQQKQPEFSIFDEPKGPQPIVPPPAGGVAPGLFNLFNEETPTQSAPTSNEPEMPVLDSDIPMQSLDLTSYSRNTSDDDEPAPFRLKTY